jgi:hypothetical protein
MSNPLEKHEYLLKYMKESVGTKEPIEFFDRMTDVFKLLFERIDTLQKTVDRIKVHSALAISWEPRVASDLLAQQVHILRQDADTYANEIVAFKKAFAEDKVTQSYQDFIQFWVDTLGYHPFLD